MKQGIISLLLFCFVVTELNAQKAKMNREDYIEAFSDLAIKEMERSGIPASITLAQGMLESDNGNSRLAVEANNHFGIKCHNGWNGKKIYHDDDHRKECFRKYDSVMESYKDHSDFLMNSSRYASLFELDPFDYKAWAKELKKAGYATSHSYADRLIRIIEENGLNKYDLTSGTVTKVQRKTLKSPDVEKTDASRAIYKRNRIDYVVVRDGDTYESLQKEFSLMPFELFRYNDLTRDSVLYPGQELYIQPKRNKAEPGKPFHIVLEGETLHEISQMYGVKPERILKMNLMSPGTVLVPGQKLSLRKQMANKMEKPVRTVFDRENKKAVEVGKTKERERRKPRIKIREDEKEKDTMEFEFK